MRNAYRALGAAVAFVLLAQASLVVAQETFDLVLAGGRVIDPEFGLDARRDVGIRDGRIAALSEAPLEGGEIVDVSGLVVSPGFIDLHEHGQDDVSNGFQARDGVTTSLDLEAGAYPVVKYYEARGGKAPINYGVAAGHIPARIKLKHGVDVVHPLTTPYLAKGFRAWLQRVVRKLFSPTAYAVETADEQEIEKLVGLIEESLDQGGIGIGLGLDYTPGTGAAELHAVFALAARRGVPCFVHMRGVARADDMSVIAEMLDVTEATGASLHIVHLNSSGQMRTAQYLTLIEAARLRGLDVTTEAYPYTAASTLIESSLFDSGWRERLGISYEQLQWSQTGERLTAETFERYRRKGGLVIIHMMKQETVDLAITHPLVMIASDGVPFLDGGEHPRGAGTYARILGRYVRERKLLTLMGALRKMTILPARRLEAFVPAMHDKGRLRVGADADITVFDPERVIDRATFENSPRASEGIPHVLVAGTFIVRDSELVPGALPGRPILAR